MTLVAVIMLGCYMCGQVPPREKLETWFYCCSEPVVQGRESAHKPFQAQEELSQLPDSCLLEAQSVGSSWYSMQWNTLPGRNWNLGIFASLCTDTERWAQEILICLLKNHVFVFCGFRGTHKCWSISGSLGLTRLRGYSTHSYTLLQWLGTE